MVVYVCFLQAVIMQITMIKNNIPPGMLKMQHIQTPISKALIYKDIDL